MTGKDVVERARSVIAKGCYYQLGSGGMRPHDPVPWDSAHKCDCSGFAAWCLGVSRQTDDPFYVKFNGGWASTEAIVRDCETPFGHFALVTRPHVLPGDLLVYGNYKGSDGATHVGHVGVCSEVDGKGPVKVIHCSSGNYRKTGDAIRETDPRWWDLAGGVIARCAWVEQ